MFWRKVVFVFVAVVLLMGAIVVFSQPSRAAGPWYVQPDGNDSNSCLDYGPNNACASIQAAVDKASPGDTIYVAGGLYTNTDNQVVLVNKNLSLSGGWNEDFSAQSHASVIDGEGARRGITVYYQVVAQIDSFFVQFGYSDSGYEGGGIDNDGQTTITNITISQNESNAFGGGISNRGTMTVTNSIIQDNQASTGGGIYNHGVINLYDCTIRGNLGGGIHNTGWEYPEGEMTIKNTMIYDNYNNGGGGGIVAGSVGSVTIDQSSVFNNVSANDGGGIHHSSGTTIITNSTISGNTSEAYGGGIVQYSGLISIYNSTISDNYARWGGGLSANVSMKNSILTNNRALFEGPDCYMDVTSLGYNLIGNSSDCNVIAAVGDLLDSEANIGQLINALGYHPLLSASPAIDEGDPSGCKDHAGNPIERDQRGVVRDAYCDIGAYEYTVPGSLSEVVATGGTPQKTAPNSAFQWSLEAAVVDDVGTPVEGVTVTFSAPMEGPSAVFENGETYATTSNESGIVNATSISANGLSGSYTITATASEIVTPAHFILANSGWFVSLDGDNSNSCQTADEVCKSIEVVFYKTSYEPGDTVLVTSDTYTGSGNEVVSLNKDARILGGWNQTFTTQNGMSTIDGENLRRGILVESDTAIYLENFVIQNGYNQDVVDNEGGGGIFSRGNLTMDNCDVRSNTSYTIGGGIVNGENLNISDSSISGNTAGNGGGIVNIGNGSLFLNNSTVSQNIATDEYYDGGGGIYVSNGLVLLSNSSVIGNSAREGGGIYQRGYEDNEVFLQNSIISNNDATLSGSDCTGNIISNGYNLFGTTESCTIVADTGDLLDIDPRVFPYLTGSPGHHALLPGSPAIDAGNPSGCTDHMGDLLTTDQRSTSRHLDGNGDDNLICDIGAYEFDPDNPSSQVFIANAFNQFQSHFFDDFSDPTSGWYVGEDEYTQTEYLNGQYRVLSKQAGYLYLFRAPTSSRVDYVVEVDIHWHGIYGSGYGYGLLFGLNQDYSEYYYFEILANYGEYRLWRRDSSGFTNLAGPTWSPAINLDTGNNHLKVIRVGDEIRLSVNGTDLGSWTDGNIVGLTFAGLATNPYSNKPQSDARFDNYSVMSLSHSGSSLSQNKLMFWSEDVQLTHVENSADLAR